MMARSFLPDRRLHVITSAESLELKNKWVWGTQELDILDEL